MTINLSEQYLDILPEIKTAIDQGKPIVALESTIISHGMPYPKNVETAKEVEQMVRDNGAIPATIAILGGRLKVGLNDQELEYLGKSGLEVTKASRRDIPFIVSRGEDGATTVAATMIISELAGISLFATGGIGGVHRDGENSMDVSADLNELSNTNVSVICAGIKSILDIGRTLEYLETMGVPVVGYQTDHVPAFYARSSGYGVDYRANSANEIAASLKAKYDMGLNGGALITNPVPEKFALNPNDIEKTINEAIQEMNKRGITGKDTTPFLLARIAEQTKGESLDTNIKLVLNNAKLAAEIAAELCKL
ncbi:MAG: pseudouridine-5'-phosphate glycosidase [Emcibacteraceae bacterium]|uniref:pseudouridine-5'-phosphate glycosidase n=1 Tax=Pseudemcibacter sp. TaxID=2943293 RepID=UPI003F6A08A5|nr:pseudouridine-5'-phosphate glycosidase [Emcibacteraceae bacterium]MDG1726016.1 pseudouridine-5'-phosphate glycosidase [Emcibacteraceae bacterium]